MKRKPTFNELIEKDIKANPDWLSYIEGNSSMPDSHPDVLKVIALFLFYMGNFKHAREVSYKSSIYFEERSCKASLESYKVSELFESALYRGLAKKEDEALELWRQAIEMKRQISDEVLLKQRMAHLWVYEAYALAKLESYEELSEPAQKGLAGINKGKATYKAQHRNSRFYGLADVLINLANHKIHSSEENKKLAQIGLLFFKKENLRYGRLGYDIIFDLQFTYPEVFEPVLPSDNLNKD